MHWPHRSQVLLDNRFNRAAPLRDVAAQTTDKTNVVGRINKDFYVQLFEQPWVGEDEYAFDNYNRLGFDCTCFI